MTNFLGEDFRISVGTLILQILGELPHLVPSLSLRGDHQHLWIHPQVQSTLLCLSQIHLLNQRCQALLKLPRRLDDLLSNLCPLIPRLALVDGGVVGVFEEESLNELKAEDERKWTGGLDEADEVFLRSERDSAISRVNRSTNRWEVQGHTGD